MTYSTLFQHNAQVSASFIPFTTSEDRPKPRGVLDLKIGILLTQITPAEARKLAADLMTAAQQYEAHFSLPIQSLSAEFPTGEEYQEPVSAVDPGA